MNLFTSSFGTLLSASLNIFISAVVNDFFARYDAISFLASPYFSRMNETTFG